MNNLKRLQILLSLCFVLATLGCGSKDTTQDAKQREPTETEDLVKKEVQPPPQATPTPAQSKTASLKIEGVPDLDPVIGSSLSEVVREESKQFNKDAMSQYKKKDYEKAIGYFIKSLEKNPSNLLYRFNLACTYSLSGDRDKSIGILKQFKETPNCPRCFIMLAKATKDKDFDSIREDAEFVKLVEGAAQRLKAELKVAKWIKFDKGNNSLPVSTNGLPAISNDGKRVAVTQFGKGSYRLEIIYVPTGKVVSSRVILNKKELAGLENGTMTATDVKPAVAKRSKKAHMMLLGREWIEFKIKANDINDEGWSEGVTAQEFKLGNSFISFDSPKLIVKNSKGKESFSGNIPIPSDDCTQYTLISKAYVIGKFHTMLFDLSNFTTGPCETNPGKHFVLKLE